jgi:beta-phosphoglucomutase family hydrolase
MTDSDPARLPAMASAGLGLPDGIRACLFDLDGVLTNTAALHAAAWKASFDDFLRSRSGSGFRPFDKHADYDEYVDGKPREDGVRDFLASRDIQPSDAEVAELADRKNQAVQQAIKRDGVEVFDGSVRYLQAVQAAGLGRIVVTASANAEQVLRVTGLQRYVQGRVDGRTLAEQHLAGKPKPDSYLAGARLAGVPVEQAAVFEDALAGVAAGRAGGFGCVVGVDRVGQADGLRTHGADLVVTDLAELLGSGW